MLSGPSGTGKDSVVELLMERESGLRFSVSATTRHPRPGEVDGVHYHFVSREEFSRMISAGEMLEYTTYSGNLYGTPLKSALDVIKTGTDVVLVIEVVGAANVKKLRPDSVTIFLKPPSMEELERRLRGRNTESEESICRRLEAAQEELKLEKNYDYSVCNDFLERAVGEVREIIEKERMRK